MNTQNARSGLGTIPSDLNEVLFAGGSGKDNLRLARSGDVIIALNHVTSCRRAITPLIDGQHRIVTAAQETDRGLAGARSRVAIPEIWTSHTMTRSVEGCIGCVKA